MGDLDAGGRKLSGEIGALHSRITRLEQVSHELINQKNVDEELDLAWREWESTFDAAKDSIVLTDGEFKIIQANLAASRLFAKPLDQIVGKTCWQLIHGTNTPPKNCPLKKAKEAKTHQEIELYLSEKGIWVTASVDPVFDQQGNLSGAVHIIKDITEHKKAGDACLSLETELKDILDNTPVGIYRTTPDGRILLANPALVRMLGYSSFEEIAVRNLEKDGFEPQYSRSIFKERIEKDGQIVGLESNWIRRDGTSAAIVETAWVVRDKQGRTLYYEGIVQDITERKHAERLLRKERDRAQKYLDVAGVMLVAIDTEQRVGLINKKGCEILGYNEDEIIAKNWFDNFLPERIKKDVKGAFNKLLCGDADAPEYYENPVLTKDGAERLIAWHNTVLRDDKGKVIAALGSGEDITERKRAEEALRESEEKYRDLFENAREAILTLDLKGNITGVNKLVEEYGFKREDLIGKSHFDFIAEKSRNKAFKEFERLTQGTPVEGEVEVITPKGNRIVEYRNNPIRRGGQIVGVQEILIDITERKKAEQQLLNDQAQLKSLASELTLAEELARRRLAVELHDRIGQSLVISKIKLEALRKTGRSRKLDKALEDVCNSIGQTIQDTRTLTFDLSSPVLYELGFETAVSEWLADQIQKKHGLAVEFEDDGEPKPLDDDVRVLLFRDVRELLINVVKHAHANKVKVSVRKLDSHICVTVEDDGVGFDPADVISMAAKRGEFGLFSIRERLENLGGHFQIDSAPGRGCKVTMTAPLKQKEMTR
jgi:PAS domain S-box-containing protein